jgi:hypothetical protein
MSSPPGSPSTRPLRLKVLYTFDTESKNNCIARWPQVMHLQTASIDSVTEIGVVNLKTCLKALLSSSPELFSQPSADYTVYAYDYSEEGTPLSGQGMLSTIFDLSREDDESSKLVTGRVTRNIMGLFSGNGQETLEVKLKLLPVAKQVQDRSMHGQSPQRELSGNSGHGSDGRSWLNSAMQSDGSMSIQRSVETGSPTDRSGLENMQRMLHESSAPREFPTNRSSDSLNHLSNSRPGSRHGTPVPINQFYPPARQSFSQASRPSSRASVRAAPPPITGKRRDSFNSGYYSGDEAQIEEGPARKRARVTTIEAPSKSDLNIERQQRQSDNLRMAASTASSVRVHRPIAVNPALSNLQGNNLAEEPFRPPTPIPSTKKPANRRQQSEPSTLRRDSQQPLPSQTTFHGHPPSLPAAGSTMSPPDLAQMPSASSTPLNIPSSPPVMGNFGSTPTSPGLPEHGSEHVDSGFVDGLDDLTAGDPAFSIDDFLQNLGNDGLDLQPPGDQDAFPVVHDAFAPVFEEENEVEEVAQPTLPPPPEPAARPTTSDRPPSRIQISRTAIRVGISSPKIAPAPYPRARQMEEEVAAQLALPPMPSSDAPGRHLQRANTWAGEMSDAPMSEAPTGDGGRANSVSKKKVGREQTKARLETAIAHNEMPPYCYNCGTIDTPAWRRVVAKEYPLDLFDTFEVFPDVPGAFVYKEKNHPDPQTGFISGFRAFKEKKSPEDKGDDWLNIQVCNCKFRI